MECLLISTPKDKTVPEDESRGTITIAGGNLVWMGSSGKRSSETIAIGDIDKKQQSKDAPKLRLLLKNGTAYVLQLASIPIREQLLQAMAGDAPVAASSAVAGNLAAQLAKGGAAASKGAAVGAAAASAAASAAQPNTQPHGRPLRAPQPVVDPNDPFAGLNPAELKQTVLSNHPELALEYQELVLGGSIQSAAAAAGAGVAGSSSAAGAGVGSGAGPAGPRVVTDAEFWDEPRHKQLLVEAAARRATKKGMSGLLAGVEAITEERAGQSEVRLRITDDYRLRVFTKEPRIFTAYKIFVPLKCNEKEFWTRYYSAHSLRQKTLLELSGAGSAGARGAAAGASSSSSSNSSKYDIALLSVDQFFDLYQRGVIDDGSSESMRKGARAGKVGSGAAVPKAGSAGAGSSSGPIEPETSTVVDPSFDLTSTAEEVVRSRALVDGRSDRAGYGLGGQLQAYETPDEPLPLGPAGAARAEALAKLERQAGSVIAEVNRGTAHLIAHMGVESSAGRDNGSGRSGAGSAGAGAGSSSARPLPSPTGSAVASEAGTAASTSTTVIRPAAVKGVGASAADDLPDLYAEGTVRDSYAPLAVDLQAVRSALQTQGEHEDAAAVNSAAALPGHGQVDAGGGWTIDTSTVAGGWSTVASSTAAAAAPAPQSTAAAARKRPRPDEPAEDRYIPERPNPADVLRKSSKAARVVLLEVTRSAHDVFAATARATGQYAGFSLDLPPVWHAFLQAHFRLDCEYQAHAWRALGEIEAWRDKQARAAAAAAASAGKAAQPGQLLQAAMQSVAPPRQALLDKARQLVGMISTRHAALENLKRRVEKTGAIAVTPPLPDGVAVPQSTTGHVPDGDKARAEAIKMLIFLQSYMDRVLEEGRRLLPAAGT